MCSGFYKAASLICLIELIYVVIHRPFNILRSLGASGGILERRLHHMAAIDLVQEGVQKWMDCGVEGVPFSHNAVCRGVRWRNVGVVGFSGSSKIENICGGSAGICQR